MIEAKNREIGDQSINESNEQTEEELLEQGRAALIEMEVEGKKFFKPKNDTTYRLRFNRAEALNVRGRPNEKFKREVKDKKTGQVIGEAPVTEWTFNVIHVSGHTQTWNITSRNLATKLMQEFLKGWSVIDFRREKTGELDTQVNYYVKGVGK